MALSAPKKRSSSKNPNYFSHEFIIQNHGDIVTCFFMVFIVGLMFQVTTPLASMFVTPKYNITELNQTDTPILYMYGWQDITLTLFYSLACIIFHAVIQEYVLDKIIKKFKLSKTRTTKFNESGQLIVFLIISLVWLVNVFLDEGYFQSFSHFWSSYPHIALRFWTKMFIILQMSYWLHTFPELYFQKVKREDMQPKITTALVYLFVFISLYVLNITRVGLALVFIDYLTSSFHHISRLILFTGKIKLAKTIFRLFNIVFVIGRLLTVSLSILVFWFGLSTNSVDRINIEEGNFNTSLTRLTCLVTIIGLQTWMMWNFILFHIQKRRENIISRSSFKANKLANKSKIPKSASSSDVSDQETSAATQESITDKVKSS